MSDEIPPLFRAVAECFVAAELADETGFADDVEAWLARVGSA